MIKQILLFTFTTLTLNAAVEYEIHTLPPSKVIALSDTGHVTGRYSGKVGYIYHPDKGLKIISGPYDDQEGRPIHVDDQGIVTGVMQFSFDKDHYGPFIYDSKRDLLLFMADPNSIEGFIYDRSTETVTAIYDADKGKNNPLYDELIKKAYKTPDLVLEATHPEERELKATVVNKNGVVAGFARPLDYQLPDLGFMWDKKRGLRFVKPLGGDGIKIKGINALSQIVGSSRDAQDQWRAFFYDEKKGMQDLGSLPKATDISARDINDQQQIVGSSESMRKKLMKTAFIWDKKHGMRDLNTLIPNRSDWKLETARRINNRGWIIGKGSYKSDDCSYLLIPRKK